MIPSLGRLGSEHAGRESFRQDPAENGSDQHQDEHRIEHSFIQHPLTVGVDRVIGDKCCGERGSDLRQRQRPCRQPRCGRVAKGAANDRRGNPFSSIRVAIPTTNGRLVTTLSTKAIGSMRNPVADTVSKVIHKRRSKVSEGPCLGMRRL